MARKPQQQTEAQRRQCAGHRVPAAIQRARRLARWLARQEEGDVRVPRVVRPPVEPINDSEHTAAPKPPPRQAPDALRILYRWRAALEAGHKTAAAVALAELQELAVRPAGRKTETDPWGAGSA